MESKASDKKLSRIEKGIDRLLSSSAREFKNISHRFDLLEIEISGVKNIVVKGRFDKRIEDLEKQMDKVKDALAL